MDRTVQCKDLGWDCGFTACAATEVELFRDVLEHSRAIHRMEDFSQGFYGNVRASIHNGYCDLEEELCRYSDCGALNDK